ncbi:metabotropic glutamate receptor 3-like [Rhopilema esculentum]|uniref:metabotropic glutamate receptor 3-like n=1 Tax=Rhopilema esculentum TaxID=499914 RepID=UPI0031E0BC0A
MMQIVGILCLCFSFVAIRAASYEITSKVPGNVTIGGLVPIHPLGAQGQCNLTSFEGAAGMLRLEAMIYTVKEINNNKTFHPVNLGLEVRDSCNIEAKALEESLNFVIDKVPDVCQGNHSNQTGKSGKLAAVVGATKSSVTAQVAKLLRLFKIPQISYASTSEELSDKTKYNFLLRTVPSDKYQARAMADFVAEKLKWKAVYGLYEEGTYGENGMEKFKNEAKRRGVCVVDSKAVKRDNDLPARLKSILDHFLKESDVIGVVLFCHQEVINELLSVLRQDKNLRNRFYWVGSDSWGLYTGSYKNLEINVTVFSLHDHSKQLLGFKDYYRKLEPGENSLNPWFDKFWCWKCQQEVKKNPKYTEKAKNLCPCEGLRYLGHKTGKEDDENLRFEFCANNDTCFHDDKVAYVIDALYAIAYALKNLYSEKCPNVTDNNALCIRNLKIETTEFFDSYLKKVVFQGVTGHVSFNESELKGVYDISNLISGSFETVGIWKAENGGSLVMNGRWKQAEIRSQCAKNCSAGSVRKTRGGKICCWDCIRCAKTQKVVSLYRCQSCGSGYRSNETFDGCVKIPEVHWDHGWLVAIAFLASVGCGLTFFVFVVFFRFRNTPVIMAASRELSYTLLLGITLCYSLTFFMAAWPSTLTCGVLRFGTGFSMSLCYAALLVKTSRIARIFSGKPDPLFITPKWQLVLTGMLVMPQVLIGVVGLMIKRPKVEKDYKSITETVVRCSADTNDLIVSISYNILLIVLCTVYAFRTRKVPENFNEARFIGFVMYTACVIWLAFLPLFYGSSYEYRGVSLCLNLILNATTILFGLFGIKMYIVLLRPEKNTRANSKARSFSFPSDSNGHDKENSLQEAKENRIKPGKRHRRNNSSSTISSGYLVNYATDGPYISRGSNASLSALGTRDISFN